MKQLLSIIALAVFTATAHAQFVQGPTRYNLLTNATTWMNVSSNGATVAAGLSTTQAPWVPVGANGFGIGIKAYATNAALTTNVWFTIALSADGVNEITNSSVTVVYLPRGVATNTYYTNFVTSTSALLGNIAAVRVKDVMSTNGIVGSSLAGNLFVESFTSTLDNVDFKIEKHNQVALIARERLYLTADQKTVVREGDPRASVLLAGVGQLITARLAKSLGLIVETHEKAPAKPEKATRVETPKTRD